MTIHSIRCHVEQLGEPYWCLTEKGAVEQLPGSTPVLMRVRDSRKNIASYLDEAHAKALADHGLYRASGWACIFSVDHHVDDGHLFCVCWKRTKEEFIGPLPTLGAAFMIVERRHRQHLDDLLQFEANQASLDGSTGEQTVIGDLTMLAERLVLFWSRKVDDGSD